METDIQTNKGEKLSTDENKSDFVSMEEYNRKYAYKVMGILVGLVLIVMYIEGMLTPSLPSIEGDFLITPAQASLVLSMYMVGGVAITPIVGKLGDIYGKRKMLIITLFIYAAAVSVTGFSPTFDFMIISRTIQGIGLSVMPLGFALVREEFPKELVPKAQALISAMFGAGFAISIPLGSLVSNDFGWRWTYHSAIPLVFGLLLVSWIVIKESRFKRPDVKIDYAGAAMLASSLSLFVFALSEGASWGWISEKTIGMILAGFFILFPLAIYELRYTKAGGEAILNYKLLSMRNVLVANVILSIAGLGMFLSMQALTYRFIFGFHDSILETGLSLVPFALGTFILGPIAGALVSKTGVKPLAALGAVISALGFILQSTLPGYNGVLVYEFLIGAGLSLLNGTLINFIVLTVNPRDMGLATAMNGTFRSLGSSIGAPIAGSILATYATQVSPALTIPNDTAYTYIFIIAALVFLAAAMLVPLGKEVLGKRGIKRPVQTPSILESGMKAGRT